MSPLPFSHLTNEIVDLTMDTSAAMRKTGDTWTMFMGVVVTLLPKIIPMVMPVIMGGDEGIKERFGGDEYEEKIEAMFRNKMLDNLEVIEGFIRAWKNDNLSLNDVAGNFGINANFIQSKSDDPLFAGEPPHSKTSFSTASNSSRRGFPVPTVMTTTSPRSPTESGTPLVPPLTCFQNTYFKI